MPINDDEYIIGSIVNMIVVYSSVCMNSFPGNIINMYVINETYG